jgi:NADPH:quinone reductase-like Zn-dependent oxidoreductase
MARIVRFHEYGDASVLKIENLDVPPPAADEAQIDVKSIGLNRAEVMFRTHAYLQEAQFPSRLGYEAAGIIKTVGTSVSSFKKGDVVSLIPPPDIARWGTYGELANVLARNLVKHPRNISFEEAAASWMQYLTAWGALIEQAKLTAGDFVVVTAASSSVGIGAFQVAKAVGATVIATTRTRAKREALIDHGADHVVVTDEENLVARVMEITRGVGARVVFDPVGGPSFIPLTDSMARGGILLEYGALSKEPTPFPLFTVLGKSLTLKGYLNGEITNDDAALERAKAFITGGLASGQLKPVIARRFPLEQIQQATRFLESNAQIGKVVVNV